MKLSELRQIIKEEINKIKNPDTGRMIKVSSALTYPKDTAVYKAAAKSKPGAAKINQSIKPQKDLSKINDDDLFELMWKTYGAKQSNELKKNEDFYKNKFKDLPAGKERFALVDKMNLEKEKILNKYKNNPIEKELDYRKNNRAKKYQNILNKQEKIRANKEDKIFKKSYIKDIMAELQDEYSVNTPNVSQIVKYIQKQKNKKLTPLEIKNIAMHRNNINYELNQDIPI